MPLAQAIKSLYFKLFNFRTKFMFFQIMEEDRYQLTIMTTLWVFFSSDSTKSYTSGDKLPEKKNNS